MKYRPTKSKRWADYRRNRRIVQEYGIKEANRVGALETPKEQKRKDKAVSKVVKKQKKIQQKISKTRVGLYIGDNYVESYTQFINSGGDPSSCPFD